MQEEHEMRGRMMAALSIIEGCREFSSIIPEVRSNLVYARRGALGVDDVMAIDGRISSVGGRPKACGMPTFGASSHMARFVLGIMTIYPHLRAGINFCHDPEMMVFLESYCAEKGWSLIGIDRSLEPAEAQAWEGGSMSWKVARALEEGREPRVVFETGAVGKEPVSVLIGEEPVQLATEICHLAKAYGSRHRGTRVGKVEGRLLDSIISGRLGVPSSKILVPPRSGVDAGVVDLEDGRVLVVAEDPIFSIPSLPLEFLGWATVNIGASDVAVMGLEPEYMTYTLLLPDATTDQELREIIDGVHSAALDLGIAIIGGHTGFVPGLESPLIGGVTVMAIGPKEGLITPMGAREGDLIIMTKGVAIEAAGVLAVVRRRELLSVLDEDTVDKAASLCRKMTVVRDAMIASGAGGVTAMHDATEGGLLGAVYEIAQASGVGAEIDASRIIIPEEVEAVCQAIGIDPLRSISEGTLIITVAPERAGGVVSALVDAGIPAGIIGRVMGGGRCILVSEEGVVDLGPPAHDPFWPAFFEGLGEKEIG